MAAPRLLLLAGASASGKDDLLRAIGLLGVGRFELVRKHTSRTRLATDGAGLVCEGEAGHALGSCDMTYDRGGATYGFSTAEVWREIHRGRFQVAAVSDPEAIRRIKHRFGRLAISVYVHPEAHAQAAQSRRFADLTDAGLTDLPGPLGSYWSAFRMYSENIGVFDHVLLHAGASEDLFDQLARLATGYEEGRLH